MEYRWETTPLPDAADVAALADALQIDPLLATLLCQRGVRTFEEARAFFRPNLADLADPFRMRGMERAVERLGQALDQREAIVIYGDYDVDGTTAVALVYDFLRKLHPHIYHYVPDRVSEGYGLSAAGIEWALAREARLLIALDCGIRGHTAVAQARAAGLDVIVCDHHLPDQTLPQAVAVLNPQRADCAYPYKFLSGCGLGFRFMQAFCRHRDLPEEAVLSYLDLVAISIGADIVPMTGENRILAAHGLRQLNEHPRPGLRALMEIAGFQPDPDTGCFGLTISEVVFGLGPRINAAGRMAHARDALHLLLADADTASAKAEVLHRHNTDRRTADQQTTEEAVEMIGRDMPEAPATVVYAPHWNKGVIGIVAARCIERFYRPTIVLTESEGLLVGSARSVEGFDVHAAIGACADLLVKFGGHAAAAGLTLEPTQLEAFRTQFTAEVAQRLTPDQQQPVLRADLEVPFTALTPKFARILRQFGPFGPEHLKPVLLTRGVYDDGSRLVGRSEPKTHLQFRVRQANLPVMEGIGFGMAAYLPQMQTGAPFELCYTLEEDYFRDEMRVRMRVCGIRFADEA